MTAGQRTNHSVHLNLEQQQCCNEAGLKHATCAVVTVGVTNWPDTCISCSSDQQLSSLARWGRARGIEEQKSLRDPLSAATDQWYFNGLCIARPASGLLPRVSIFVPSLFFSLLPVSLSLSVGLSLSLSLLSLIHI